MSIFKRTCKIKKMSAIEDQSSIEDEGTLDTSGRRGKDRRRSNNHCTQNRRTAGSRSENDINRSMNRRVSHSRKPRKPDLLYPEYPQFESGHKKHIILVIVNLL